jgi:hypothetical protein
LTVTSIGRRGWSQAKSSLTTKLDGRITLPLADVLDRVVDLQAQLEELTRIVTTQVEVGNQTTELLGRLLATSTARLEALETALGSRAASPVEKPSPPAGTPRQPRNKTEAKNPAPGDESQR